MENAVFNTVYPQWVRYPGPLPLSRVFPGDYRDF
jgi:hypothetical protein